MIAVLDCIAGNLADGKLNQEQFRFRQRELIKCFGERGSNPPDLVKTAIN